MLLILARLISLFPLWLIYSISEVFAFLLYHVFRYRRGVVRQNLTQSFPEKSKSEIKTIEKDFYRNFPRVFLEIIKSYSFKKEDWLEHVTILNPELPLRYLDGGTPVILMGGHTANWEWTAFSVGQLMGYPIEFLYKPVKSESFNHLMLKLRERHGGLAVPKDDAVRHIIKRRKQIRTIGIIGDQLPSMGTEKVWLNFLNKETPFYVGAERIATMVGYATFFVDFVRISRGKYELKFIEIARPPYEKGQTGIIEAYVRELEKSIRANPSDYLWSHKRWKYTKEEEEAHLASL